MPFGRQGRADEEDFEQTGTESSVEISLTAPNGTTDITAGDSQDVQIVVQRISWEVWTGTTSGAVEFRNYQTEAVSADLAYSIVSGSASVSNNSGSTDANGAAVVGFTMGSDYSTLRVDVSYDGGSTAFANLDFSPAYVEEPEEWSYDHTESLLQASLSTSESTEVPSGESRTMQVHVDFNSWEIWTSNRGNTEAQNFQSSPAAGAEISWSVLSGDGSVTTGSESSPLDGSGNASAAFTMASIESVVEASVSYAGSDTAAATLTFSLAGGEGPPPEEEWYYGSSDSAITAIELSADEATDGMSPGDQRTLTATVTQSTWEEWYSNLNNTDTANETPGPAASVIVDFVVESGDGTLTAVSAVTDSSGQASVVFTMGSGPAQVRASLTSAGLPDLSAVVDFHTIEEVWFHDSDESATNLSFTGPGPFEDLFPGNSQTLTAVVTDYSWEVWVSNLGNTMVLHENSSPVASVSLTFTVDAGDGQLSAASAVTDAYGQAAVQFTMGMADASVRAQINGNDVSASIGFMLHPEEWTHTRNEATISTTLSSDGPATEVATGTTQTVTAEVLYTSWEVWTSDFGRSKNINYDDGPAINADVEFSIESGDGTISNAAISTDNNGNATATFTMGTEDCIVRADASYASATSIGSLNFSVDPWTKDHEEERYEISLSADDTTVTANVSMEEWDVFKNGTQTRIQNYQAGPAIGASVAFDFLTGSGTLSPASADTVTDGTASTAYSVSDPATIQATVSFSGGTAVAAIDVEPPPPGCNCENTDCPHDSACTCGGDGSCETTPPPDDCGCGNGSECPGSGCTCGGDGSCVPPPTDCSCGCTTCADESDCVLGSCWKNCNNPAGCSCTNCRCGRFSDGCPHVQETITWVDVWYPVSVETETSTWDYDFELSSLTWVHISSTSAIWTGSQSLPPPTLDPGVEAIWTNETKNGITLSVGVSAFNYLNGHEDHYYEYTVYQKIKIKTRTGPTSCECSQ